MKKQKLQYLATWKIVLGVSVCFLLCVEVVFLMRAERARMLALQARRTAAHLMDFAQARAQLNARDLNESVDQYRKRISAENAETQFLYTHEFYGQVAHLRDEFARRGVTDNELDKFYGEPVYPVGIREVGQRLYVLAHRTDPSIP